MAKKWTETLAGRTKHRWKDLRETVPYEHGDEPSKFQKIEGLWLAEHLPAFQGFGSPLHIVMYR
jgi:hypothetical protein